MALADLLKQGYEEVGVSVEEGYLVLENKEEGFMFIYDGKKSEVVYGCRTEFFPRELYLVRYTKR